MKFIAIVIISLLSSYAFSAQALPKASETGKKYLALVKATQKQFSKNGISPKIAKGISGIGNGGDFLVCNGDNNSKFLDRFVADIENKSHVISMKSAHGIKDLDSLIATWKKRESILAEYNPEVAKRWHAYVEAFTQFINGQQNDEFLNSESPFEFHLIPAGSTDQIESDIVDDIYLLNGSCRYQTKSLHISLSHKTVILYDEAQFNDDLKDLENLSWSLTHEFLWDVFKDTNGPTYDLTVTRGLNIALHSESFFNQNDLALNGFLRLSLAEDTSAIQFDSAFYYANLASVYFINEENIQIVTENLLKMNKATKPSFQSILTAKSILLKLIMLAHQHKNLTFIKPITALVEKCHGITGLSLILSDILSIQPTPEIQALLRKDETLIQAFDQWMNRLSAQKEVSSALSTQGILLMRLRYARGTFFGQ